MPLFHVIFTEPEMNLLVQPCRGEGGSVTMAGEVGLLMLRH